MNKNLFIAAFLTVLPAIAQDERTITLGEFDTSGSATFGYRFTDVSGRKEKFQELFNLQSGPRLLDFNFGGRAKEGTSPFADAFNFTASGLSASEDAFPEMAGFSSEASSFPSPAGAEYDTDQIMIGHMQEIAAGIKEMNRRAPAQRDFKRSEGPLQRTGQNIAVKDSGSYGSWLSKRGQ